MLIVIHISFLMKSQFKSFAHFKKIELFVLLVCKNYLYIPDTSSLSHTSFFNILFQSMASLAIFLKLCLKSKILKIFYEVHFPIIFFWCHTHLINCLPKPRSERFSLCFFQKFYSFSSYSYICALFWISFCVMWAKFILFPYEKSNCSSIVCWNDSPSHIGLFWPLCQNSVDHKNESLLLDCISCFTDLQICSYSSIITLSRFMYFYD